MKEIRHCLILLTLWAAALPAAAGEGLVVKVRGPSLSINQGAEDGMMVGMMVTVIRPPTEAYIHPITGENLGAPEIELVKGEVTKVSSQAATVRIQGNAILPVQAGDVVRFTTVEEEMVMEQQQSAELSDKAAAERQAMRGDVSGLARDVKNIQGSIRTLQNMMKRLERVDEAIKVQLRGINKDMTAVKEDLRELKETVSLMGTVPVDAIGENGSTLGEADIEQMRGLIQEEIQNLRVQIPVANQVNADMATAEENILAEDPELTLEDEFAAEEELEEEEAKPFYQQLWFYLILLVVGLAAVAFFVYTRMMGGEEDEEIEGDDDLDDEEDDDFEIEAEEEDDIVVEETT